MTTRALFEILTWAEYFLTGGKMPANAGLDASSEIVKLITRYEGQIEKLESDIRNLDLHRAALEGENKELSEKYHKVHEANIYLGDRLRARETELGHVLMQRNELDAKLKQLPESMQRQLVGKHEVCTDDERHAVDSMIGSDDKGDCLNVPCPFCKADVGQCCKLPGDVSMGMRNYHWDRMIAAQKSHKG